MMRNKYTLCTAHSDEMTGWKVNTYSLNEKRKSKIQTRGLPLQNYPS